MCVLKTHISQLAAALNFLADRQAYTRCLLFMQSVSTCRVAGRSMS